MASTDKETVKRLRSLSECCICLRTYTDPRLLSCFHNACLKCLEDLQSKSEKKPGDVLPCPLCRKEFSIPPEGMTGLPRNFFIESLMEVTNAFNLENESVNCTMCVESEASERCLDCSEVYCLKCAEMHRRQRATTDHKIVRICDELKEEDIRNVFPNRKCKTHSDKELELFCIDCRSVVCVSCLDGDHQEHTCKGVKSFDKDFRQKIEDCSTRMHAYRQRILSRKLDIEGRRKKFRENALETDNSIRRRSEELKALIDRHTQHVLTEFALLRQKHQKQIEAEVEDTETKLTALESFIAYCTELKSKGSPSDVCGSVDSLIARAKELNKENDAYLASSTGKFVDNEFVDTGENALLQNVIKDIGTLSESTNEFESCAVAISGDEGFSSCKDVKINLNRPNDVTDLQPIPTKMQKGASAAVDRNTIFIIGIGATCDEIWRLDGRASKWKKCASLTQDRQYHSVAFASHVLYICGGYVDSSRQKLDNVEIYDRFRDKCSKVGRLAYAVSHAGNCMPFKTSLYIFGGWAGSGKAVGSVQAYDTKSNTCSLLSKTIPNFCGHLRGVLWKNTAILFGYNACFMYNFDTETWNVRDKFKSAAVFYGLTVNDGKLFLIGDSAGNDTVRWIPMENICNDKVIEWRHHANLPKSSFGYIFANSDSAK